MPWVVKRFWKEFVAWKGYMTACRQDPTTREGGRSPRPDEDDPIHEVTFQAHDLTHFLLPDLLFTGEHTPLYRRLYILYRMLSEAVTLVFSDMLFAEALRRGGLEYDWSKRKIWPVFRDSGLEPVGAPACPLRILGVFRTRLEANGT